MTGKDPKSMIDDGAMRVGQWLAVLVTVGLTALDGFDVLSISFASPGIAKDWGIDKATLGWVLSMELLGMALGSLLLGGVADKLGRRPTILGCLVAMAIGMSGAGHAHGVSALVLWRLLTGLGIGGTLASINAAAAELSNRRWRNFALALMVIGYPLGGSLGGLFVQRLLATTVLITFAYFAHITSFYFILKWVPKIVVDMGFAPQAAAGVLTWANVGGATGGAIFGLIATRIGLKPLTVFTLLAGSLMIAWFGRGSADLAGLKTTLAVTGMFPNSAIAGLYLLFAKVFPTHVRATGTGFAIGVGRGGAALAPVVAGYLFHAGFALQTVALLMASGSLLAAAALLALKVRDADLGGR